MPKEVIRDIGEKIGGARKDLYGTPEFLKLLKTHGKASKLDVGSFDGSLTPAKFAWVAGIDGYLRSSHKESKELGEMIRPVVPVLSALFSDTRTHVSDPLVILCEIAERVFAQPDGKIVSTNFAPHCVVKEPSPAENFPRKDVISVRDECSLRLRDFCESLADQAETLGFIEGDADDVDGIYGTQSEGLVSRLMLVLNAAFGHVTERALLGSQFRPGKRKRVGVRIGWGSGRREFAVTIGALKAGIYSYGREFRSESLHLVPREGMHLLRCKERPVFDRLPEITGAPLLDAKHEVKKKRTREDEKHAFYKRLRATPCEVDGRALWRIGISVKTGVRYTFLDLGKSFPKEGRNPDSSMWEWCWANLDRLKEEFGRHADGASADFRISGHTPRAGPALVRPALDDSGESLRRKFNLRAIEWGNHVPQKERVAHLRQFHDAMMDLSDALGVEPSALGLDGRLAIAFGSRGRGGARAARAHFEPSREVINLTRRSGGGCLAHEWFHAYDFMTKVNERPHFSHLSNDYYDRSRRLDGWRKAASSTRKPYYALHEELDARAFEDVIGRRLAAKGQRNDYLVDRKRESDWDLGADEYPYPNTAEAEVFDRRLDDIMGRKRVERDMSMQYLDSEDALARWGLTEEEADRVVRQGEASEVSASDAVEKTLEDLMSGFTPSDQLLPSKSQMGQLDLGL